MPGRSFLQVAAALEAAHDRDIIHRIVFVENFLDQLQRATVR